MKKNKPENMTDDELRTALGLDDDPNYAGDIPSDEISKYLKDMENEDLQAAWDDFDDLMSKLSSHLSMLEKLLINSRNFRTPEISFSKGSDELYADERAFQADTVARVENFFLEVLNQNEPFEGNLDELKLSIGVFLGEAIVENLEGEWMICEDKTLVDYGKPVVALWEIDNFGPPLNSFEIVEVLYQTRRIGILNGAIKGMAQGSKKA